MVNAGHAIRQIQRGKTRPGDQKLRLAHMHAAADVIAKHQRTFVNAIRKIRGRLIEGNHHVRRCADPERAAGRIDIQPIRLGHQRPTQLCVARIGDRIARSIRIKRTALKSRTLKPHPRCYAKQISGWIFAQVARHKIKRLSRALGQSDQAPYRTHIQPGQANRAVIKHLDLEVVTNATSIKLRDIFIRHHEAIIQFLPRNGSAIRSNNIPEKRGYSWNFKMPRSPGIPCPIRLAKGDIPVIADEELIILHAIQLHLVPGGQRDGGAIVIRQIQHGAAGWIHRKHRGLIGKGLITVQ